MTRYWAMRTDKDSIKFIFRELKKGKLRQGWGWRDDLNLNIIRNALQKGKKLNDDQEDVWRRQRRMHPKEEDSIQKGDYIILPNLPKIGLWSVAKVSGGYNYDIDSKMENFGHILDVKLLNPSLPINPNSEYVSANLRKTMTCRQRLWNIDEYEEDIEKLILAIENGREISKPITEIEKIEKIYNRISKKLEKELRNKYHGYEFEFPIEKLLEKIYQNVEKRAGSGEKGADFICDFTDNLGVSYRIAVQVKMWEGETDWERPLKQIKKAYNNYENISAGVIITTSDTFSENFEASRRDLEKKLDIPIVIIDKRKLINLLLKYLPEFIEIE